jgi:cardiolipin synthase
VQLLEGSGELFPALIAAMDGAARTVMLETYIFDFSGTAGDVAAALERAARRGVSVQVVVDGLGTPPPPRAWRDRFADAGVEWAVYSPPGLLGMLVPGRWQRMHRKLCLVDGHTAFCGGINILDDYHDPNHGTLTAPRFDFALQVQGPLVRDAARAMTRLWLRLRLRSRLQELGAALEGTPDSRWPVDPGDPVAPGARAGLALRDNLRYRTRIERAYRKAIGGAREEIIIANAYFVPGRKMRKALIMAARRGVRVRLLLQGRYEYFMQYYSSRPVYGSLLRAGVEIHEYAPSFLHAKVAVVDGRWATVGSSNLDPLSMLLAREANVMVEDAGFAQALRARLLRAMTTAGQLMDARAYADRPLRERLKEWLALVVMRLALLVHGKEYL